jgi:hypothetical protein
MTISMPAVSSWPAMREPRFLPMRRYVGGC